MLKRVKLHFVLVDTWRTYIAAVHENQHYPYHKRIVTIELSPEQLSIVQPRQVGSDGGQPRYEELFEVVPEPEYEEINDTAKEVG